MKKVRITCISDTHTKHNKLNGFLPGGDILLCAGDISSRGYIHELEDFFEWYNNINNYDTKVFIAGNHDFGFQDDAEKIKGLLTGYKTIDYLQDDWMEVGEHQKIMEKWNLIPNDVDILVTHGPAHGKLDYVPYDGLNVGCEDLLQKIQEIKPKIHVSGHIHEGAGYVFDGTTHFINAAVLNGRYEFRNKPLTIDWDSETNEIEFVEV